MHQMTSITSKVISFALTRKFDLANLTSASSLFSADSSFFGKMVYAAVMPMFCGVDHISVQHGTQVIH
jgi:hypothetical protein